MQGRLENALKTEKNIQSILSTMPQYVVDYYYNLATKREPKSCLEYLRKIKNFLTYVNKDIAFITDTDIARYMKSIEVTNRGGVSKETSFSYRKQVHTILNSFFEYLKKKKYIQENPVGLIERENSADYVKRKFLNEKELRKILVAIQNGAGSNKAKAKQANWKERDLAIFMLFIQTGIRETALTEINISDIDFNSKKLKVIDKGHKEKDIILSDEVIEALSKWIAKRNKLMSQSNQNNIDALFVSSERKRITSQAVSNLIIKYSREALGIKITPHKLRAAYANILLRKTGNLHMVSKLMGHARPDTTEIYLDDNSDEDKERAANIIASSVFK